MLIRILVESGKENNSYTRKWDRHATSEENYRKTKGKTRKKKTKEGLTNKENRKNYDMRRHVHNKRHAKNGSKD